MIKVRGLNHTGLRVNDTQTARDFYVKVLGMKEVPRAELPGAGMWLSVGNTMIHILETDRQGVKIDPTAPHVAIDVEDLEESKRTLAELGIEFEVGVHYPGAGRQIFLLDPFGNTVELRVND